jgi:hypothetical protein
VKPRLRPVLLLCWALSGATALAAPESKPDAPPTPASPVGLDELMGRFAASGGVRARFRETKHLALLARPLETEGLLFFAPPNWLARYTTRPGASSIVVRGDRVAFRDETGHQQLTLGSNDVARHFVDNLVVLLRGDLQGLRSRYAVAFRSEDAGWEITLEPRSETVRDVIEWIRFAGRGDHLTRLETLETSGDRTVTVFGEVEPDRVFPPAELDRIFSLEETAGAP